MSEEASIRKILVAVDDSPGSLAAARAAAKLAALLEAELQGLFVEDDALLALARSALAHEIDFLTHTSRGLETQGLERQLRVHAGRARRAFEQIAEQLGVPCTFRVTRGPVTREIVAAAAGADLVSLGQVGFTVRGRAQLGRTARELLTQRNRVVLLLDRPLEITPPIVVLFDGSAAGRNALAFGARLGELTRTKPRVLLVGPEPAALRTAAAELIGNRGAHLESIGEVDDARLAHAITGRGAGVVIVPTGETYLTVEHVQALLAPLRCPVVAVS